MLTNHVVRLSSATGEIDRLVVRENAEIIEICTMEEYDAARRDGRIPVVIGFRRDSVLKVLVDLSVRTKHNGQYESVATGEAGRGGVGPG
jgi:hypothetical protein